ncbi:MAG TPA: Holliday junction branch migration protein RuvA [Flavobacteriales bacterium]|nr:Holliday junction branch migration protein RuvA [Flavobacteriales bacterium]HIN40502.1 Holliday junction branch migration protein RuvA [Flavobacteriales bacterium]
MITHINGRLVEKNPTYVIIECNGIGYFLNISLTTYSKLPEDESCKLYTHFSVKEDAQTLYGFVDLAERNLFRHLISVSGVGPSTARMVLSSMDSAEIHNAILTGNVGLIQSVKGIGAKTAQRLILDLRDKLAKEDLDVESTISSLQIDNNSFTDALSALQMLGFAKNVAEKAIGKVLKAEGNNLSVEQLIKLSLKNV